MHEEIESDADAEFLCECGDASCTQHIRMTLAEYEALREEPRHFAVVPGHGEPSVEAVVDRRAGYDVVRKLFGTPSELATRESPR